MGKARRVFRAAAGGLLAATLATGLSGCYGVYCATGTLCPADEASTPIWILGLAADGRATPGAPGAETLMQF